MKKLFVLFIAVSSYASCNNATDDNREGPDTTSSVSAPTTIDTNRLKPDSPKVEKALRK